MGYQVESQIAKKQVPPKWYLDEPFLHPCNQWYYGAFNELSSCRSLGMGIGPIPWRDIYHYATVREFDETMKAAFIEIIMAMDATYLKLKAKEKPQKPPKTRTVND